mmetsp:Transcript_43461/g.86271  ORF Transcript_43461/g.86271 Transcript_43461/m.86271 type:complete len:640 (-) Transcript_43461:207-2126(-)
MYSTPRPSPCQASLGTPWRASAASRRQRSTHSPGAASADSMDGAGAPPASAAAGVSGSPRKRTPSTAARPVHLYTTARQCRDPRPVGDKGYAALCARNVVEVLRFHGFPRPMSHEKLLKDPSTRDFFDIFRFLLAQLDPQLEMEGKAEDEVPVIMRRLRYPVEVIRSKLQAISGPNTWPQLLAVLDWLTMLVRMTDDVIEPVAACELGLSDVSDVELQDAADHQLLQSLHENYVQYLSNKDDDPEEERMQHIYEERISALRGEIDRLQQQHTGMEQRLEEFQREHERLLELQKEPAQLEVEAEHLRAQIHSTDVRVQQLEDQIAQIETDEAVQLKTLDELRSNLERLKVQVESQPFSKRDIERLKCERSQLRQVHADLQSDVEKVDQDIWELGMKDANCAEAIVRQVRRVNETAESLASELLADVVGEQQKPRDFAVRVNLDGPIDGLPTQQDFDALQHATQQAASVRTEVAQTLETALHGLVEEQRVVQEELLSREREGRRLKLRLEQLHAMREEHRTWSAEQLDDAQRTTEATEDSVHAVPLGGSCAPSLRDAAEVDRLRMLINEEKIRFLAEKERLREHVHRDEEKFETHRSRVIQELSSYAQTTRELLDSAAAAVQEDELAHARYSTGAGALGGA